MCDFLSACICRDGRIVADGVHRHTELARRYIAGENGIGRQRFWEWELSPESWLVDADPKRALRRMDEEPPDRVIEASRELIAELSTLNGTSRLLPWLAVLRTGYLEYLPTEVRTIVLLGDANLNYIDGSQSIAAMRDSSQVGAMSDSSKVGEMFDSSQVGEMWGSSQVGEMWDSSTAPRNPIS